MSVNTEMESYSINSESDLTQSNRSSDASRFFSTCFSLLLIFSLCWIVCWQLNKTLPDIKPGSNVINNAKASYIKSHAVFSENKPIKVLIFGNSKALAGFIPKQFDQAVPGATSFNVGFAGSGVFIPQLKELLARGQIPTDVLITIPWGDNSVKKKSLFHFLPRDKKIIHVLFPFHLLLRNAAVFLLRSKKYGGPLAYYRYAEKQVEEMYCNDGYFFIEDQSHFSDERLPKNFHLVSDNPSLIQYRPPNIHSNAFQELKKLSDQYNFKILVVPYYLRQGERASPGVDYAMVDALQPYHEFSVLGADYVLYKNKYFSDIAHLNPTGAKIYTKMLANLVLAELHHEKKTNAI